MTTDEAIKLAKLLARKGNGLTIRARLEPTGTWITFEGGRTGEHSLAIAVSDEKRVRAHFEGYCRNNGLTPPKVGSVVRAFIGGIYRNVRVIKSTERRVVVEFYYKGQYDRYGVPHGEKSQRALGLAEVSW